MDFELWWAGYYKPSKLPAVFDMAMKEIAMAAWFASREEVEHTVDKALAARVIHLS